MTKRVTAEIYIAVNEDGDWAIGVDEELASEALTDDYGGYSRRIVKIKVELAAPEVIETEVTVPDEAGQTVTVEVES